MEKYYLGVVKRKLCVVHQTLAVWEPEYVLCWYPTGEYSRDFRREWGREPQGVKLTPLGHGRFSFKIGYGKGEVTLEDGVKTDAIKRETQELGLKIAYGK